LDYSVTKPVKYPSLKAIGHTGIFALPKFLDSLCGDIAKKLEPPAFFFYGWRFESVESVPDFLNLSGYQLVLLWW
jgi:hypothetical protein